jgi:hypothetical protein
MKWKDVEVWCSKVIYVVEESGNAYPPTSPPPPPFFLFPPPRSPAICYKGVVWCCGSVVMVSGS